MENKGYVDHEEEGKAHRYGALVSRKRAGRSALRWLLRKIFVDSPELLFTIMMSDRKLSAGELDGMRRILERLPGAEEQ